MHRLFRDEFTRVFEAHYQRLYRYLDRLSGDPDLAADLAQEAFTKLYLRGSLPEEPGAWLATVANNLFRNVHNTRTRRSELLKVVPEASRYSDHAVEPDVPAASSDIARRVRRALDAMPERDRSLLLLRAEGYSYREMAAALEMNEASVGTLLARAKRAFRELYEARSDASR
jgi:RNA polymerase sigma-70 factor (ECF subfamily)